MLPRRKIKSSKYIKGQVAPSDAFCNTWVDLMRNEDLLAEKTNSHVSMFKRVGK